MLPDPPSLAFTIRLLSRERRYLQIQTLTMQKEYTFDQFIHNGPAPIPSTQQTSPSSAPCPGSQTSTLPSPRVGIPRSQTMVPKLVPVVPRSTPSELPPGSPAVQRQHIAGFDVEDAPSLSTSTTWDVPSVKYTCFSPTAHDADSRISKRSVIQRVFDKSWIQPTIGLTTLLITLIALFVYSHRGFVTAKWTEKNDLL